ncbi:hypothetical protein LOTGIDRAFT_160754 [Lottia gigantea]|uniref:EMI domain-containing protein n=1 Tax=Lottia gigantea TaxID=225164 RepID=V4C0M4_LOTGI|nr:hypothetical protein LOTGIDRAFT_160754 [Lottia gigantea]ESO94999.1 hypothetical protein LOTGIDRAFT_160754 [Lottia gigantea]
MVVPISILTLYLVYLLSLVTGEMCSKAVPVPRPAKRVHVLKRIPAACSNWDKSWTWLTKVDCGTKYKLDYVTVAPKEILKYKLTYVCCNGDTNCQKGHQVSGFDTSDEKFLAIVLGSTAAAVLILIIVITISVCHKRRGIQCPLFCEDTNHTYETPDDDVNESNGEGELDIGDNGAKIPEAMYEEIADYKKEPAIEKDEELPRYTDLFKEKLTKNDLLEAPDPFNNATAPPLTPDKRETDYNSEQNVTQVKEVLSGTAKILQKSPPTGKNSDSKDISYYNCDDNKNDFKSADISPSLLHPKQDSDSISNVSNCSTYEQLLDPVIREKAEIHEYQGLLEKNHSCDNVIDETTRLTSEPSSPSLHSPNGRVDVANC